MNHYLHNQYRETKAKFTKFSSRLEKSQERGDFYRLAKRKQHFLVSRVRKLWEKLRLLEVQLKITTVGASLACLMMVSNLSAQQYQHAPDKNPIPPPSVFGINPFLADIDNDGDLDLIASSDFYGANLFENTGTAANPKFELLSESDNPLNTIAPQIDFDPWDIVDIKDIDDDGDMDIISDDGYLILNSGTNEEPDYSSYVEISSFYNSGLGDIDDDGDLDLLKMGYSGNIRIYENIGDASNFDIADSYTEYPIANLAGNSYLNSPRIIDLDDDGDLDIFGMAEYYDYDTYGWSLEPVIIRNTGTKEVPAFELESAENNPYKDLPRTWDANPGDLDDDGDYDMLIFSYEGGIRYFELDNGSVAENKTHIEELYDGITLPVSYYAGPQFVDYDGDGDLDLFTSDYYTQSVVYFEYRETSDQLKYVMRDDLEFDFLDPLADHQLATFTDLDDDGDTDVILLTVFLSRDAACFRDERLF